MSSDSDQESEPLTHPAGHLGQALDGRGRSSDGLESLVNLAQHESLDAALRRKIAFACRLTKARYGAIGTVDDEYRIIHFIQVGVDAQTEREIGSPPSGMGLLGMLIRRATAIRVHDCGDLPEFTGFLPHHPIMTTLLCVPISVGNVRFGSLYLTNKEGGADFTEADEELVVAFARDAGIAVENALVSEDSQRRARWLVACADLAHDLIEPSAEGGADALHTVTERAMRESGADLASIGLPTSEPGMVFSAAASGPGADKRLLRQVAIQPELIANLRDGGRAVLLDSLNDVFLAPEPADAARRAVFSNTMVVPLTSAAEGKGMLILARKTGNGPFHSTDVQMVEVYATYVSLALELTEIHRRRQREAVMGDRERIALNLHDVIIQRIYALALSVQGLRRYTTEAPALELISSVTREMDETIRELRNTIYQLENLSIGSESINGRLLSAIQQATDALDMTSSMHLTGLVDRCINEDLMGHVLAVLSEGLSNVARHSGATSVEVSVKVAHGRIIVVIADDGRGFENIVRHGGLDNLRRRARSCHGRFTLTSPPGRGTRLVWSAPTALSAPIMLTAP